MPSPATPTQPAVTTPPGAARSGARTQTTSTTAADTQAAAAPAGGPVPPGFVPVSFTAISDDDFWLLGTAPCSRPVCTSIVRTTDGGAHFVGIPAPAAPIDAAGMRSGIAQLGFADQLDGFAGGTDASQPGPLWETHDGGDHWHKGPAGAITFTVTAGRVYVLTATCSNGVCSHLRLDESPAASDDWTTTPISMTSTGTPALAASGAAVWLSLSPAGDQPRSQTLFASGDDGRTLTEEASPCVPGLGGRLEASSATVLWAVCPTGTMAGAWRSTDAGAHWASLRPSRELSNGAIITPVSDSAAALAVGGEAGMIRTTDGGQTFTAAAAPNGGTCQCTWIGFTDPATGSALVTVSGTPGPDNVPPTQLWRTSDGGSSWRGPVRIAAGS